MPRRASQSKRLGPDSARKKNQGQETLERAAKAVDGASKRYRIPAFRPLCSSADRGAQGDGEGLGKAVDIGLVFGFHNDTSELLGPGIAKNDEPVFANHGLRLDDHEGN